MLTWNRRDSMPLSAAPGAPKGDQILPKPARGLLGQKRGAIDNYGRK